MVVYSHSYNKLFCKYSVISEYRDQHLKMLWPVQRQIVQHDTVLKSSNILLFIYEGEALELLHSLVDAVVLPGG
jgi:hypothetical protein